MWRDGTTDLTATSLLGDLCRPFYHLVTELYAESTDIPVQFKLVSEGRLKRYQRKRSRQIQGQVFGLWKQYFRREITASQLLRECAFVYGPSAQ